MTTTDQKSSLWASARDSYRSRRALRAAYRQAERELATYTTPADIRELDAMLERSTDTENTENTENTDNTDNTDNTVYTRIIEQIRLRAA